MKTIQLYPTYQEATFIDRENRFVFRLKNKNGQQIKAYIANPGRMEEFLITGHPFFITCNNPGKYFYRVVSTYYQNSFILLDTIKTNSLVEMILKNNQIDIFKDIEEIKREVSINRSKFDFLLQKKGQKSIILEIKSCSLCHKGVAMFPDAPTQRGKRHLEDLEELTKRGYESYTLYWINHKNAEIFIPNGHTDLDYCQTFIKSKNVNKLAFCIELINPITLNLSYFKPVKVDYDSSQYLCQDKGSYLLVFRNPQDFPMNIGALGEKKFKKGYYVYVGSSQKMLGQRIKRHLRKRKKIHWHLDYISPVYMKIEKIFPIRWPEKLEPLIAQELLRICDEYVKGFGASDSHLPSHFFFFKTPPYQNRNFINTLLDFRMGIRK